MSTVIEKKEHKPVVTTETPIKRKERGKSAFPPTSETHNLQRMADDFVESKQTVTGIRAKLQVSQPGDASEIEADRMADHVVCGGSVDKDKLSRKSNGVSAMEVDTHTAGQINTISGGSPLSESDRGYFEPRFGADFSNVRVHTDEKADRMAKSVNAKAFTKGNDIVFAKEQFKPGSTDGQKLMAHELAHVVQGGGVQRKEIQRTPGVPNPRYTQNNRGAVTIYTAPHYFGVFTEDDFEAFYNTPVADSGYPVLVDNVECIAYYSYRDSIEYENRYVISATESQWRQIFSVGDIGELYGLIIRPFMLAALNKLPDQFMVLRNMPTQSEILAFIRVLYGTDEMGNNSTMRISGGRDAYWTLPDDDVLAEFISHYQSLVIQDNSERDRVMDLGDVKSLADQGTIRFEIFGQSVSAKWHVVEAMLKHAMASAIAGAALAASDKTQYTIALRMIGNSATIIRAALDIRNDVMEELDEDADTIFDFVWDKIPFPEVAKEYIDMLIKEPLRSGFKLLLNIPSSNLDSASQRHEMVVNYHEAIKFLGKIKYDEEDPRTYTGDLTTEQLTDLHQEFATYIGI